MTIKEDFLLIQKTWGYELVLVNRPDYAAKILLVDKGAKISDHCHKIKTETFYCLEGRAILTINGEKKYDINPMARPKTILPFEYHELEAQMKTAIMEVSTHDEASDSYRLNQSSPSTDKRGKWDLDNNAFPVGVTG